MIRIKDHKTGYIFDPWWYLGPKRRRLLEQSWAGLFRRLVLEELPVSVLAARYRADFGRPSKELYTLVGAVLLQQAFDLSDAATVEELAFNEQWHYALDITAEDDESKYLCAKTLWTVRSRCAEDGLDAAAFAAVTAKLAGIFGVAVRAQRLDSVHVRSNMRRLSRLALFVAVMRQFLVNLRRHHPARFAGLPAGLTDRYTKKTELSAFGLVKPSEAAGKLAEAARDLAQLVSAFADDPAVNSMTSFKKLGRVLAEQCAVEADAVAVKPAAAVPAASLQNPSDPEAGYSAHKGQGYQAQVMETYAAVANEKEKEKEQRLNLITYVEVESAAAADAKAVVPALAAVAERGLSPAEVVADSQYGGDDNCEAARAMGVEVVAPVMGGGRLAEGGLRLSDFEWSDELTVARCPGGHAPLEIKPQARRLSAAFDGRACEVCPLSARCPARGQGGRRRYLRYNGAEVRISQRRAAQETPGFKERYRWRAGVEATMSQLDRRTGLKRLRVRGHPAVRFAVTMKVLAVNIFRATRARSARQAAGTWIESAVYFVLGLHFHFKTFGPRLRGTRPKNFQFFAPPARLRQNGAGCQLRTAA